MFTEFVIGQTVRHLDLNIIGTVESNLAIRVHVPNSPVRELLNVKIGESDLVWWGLNRVAPVSDIPLTSPALESTTVIA